MAWADRLLKVLFLTVIGCWLSAGCNGKAPPSSESAAPAAPELLTVATVKPERQTVRRTVAQPGEIQAFEQTPIYAKIAGYVRKVHKDIGDPVKAGELLAELWVPEMDEEVKRKTALVRQAEAEQVQKKKAYSAAEANVKSAQAKVREAESDRLRAAAEAERAKSTYDRLKKSTAVLSQEILDETKLGYESARAAVAQVEAKILSAQAVQAEAEALMEKAKADIIVAEAHHEVAKADRDQAQTLLNYAKVAAPFAGVVTRRNVDTGHFLQPASGGVKGEPLFVVVRSDPVRIFVDVPETDAGWVVDGTAAVVRVQALKGQEFKGKVTRSAWSLDARTRTLRAEIDLANAGGILRPGMYAYAALTLEHAQTWTLPAAAVVSQDDGVFCFQVRDGKAIRTPLQVGLSDGQRTEILKQRVPGGEDQWVDFTGNEVIAANPAALKDGQAVAQR